MSKTPLTSKEQLDEVYKMLKSQERHRTFGMIFKLTIWIAIGFAYYSIFMTPQSEFSKTLKTFISERVKTAIGPIASDITKEMTSKMQSDAMKGLEGKVSPEQIQQFQQKYGLPDPSTLKKELSN